MTQKKSSAPIKAILAGGLLMTISLVIAGVPDPFMPMRLQRLFFVIVVTAFALVSLMFLLMVRSATRFYLEPSFAC